MRFEAQSAARAEELQAMFETEIARVRKELGA
jgi:hypothetical protein